MEFILDWFDSMKSTEVAGAPTFLVSLFIEERTDAWWSVTEAINQVKLSTTVVYVHTICCSGFMGCCWFRTCCKESRGC